MPIGRNRSSAFSADSEIQEIVGMRQASLSNEAADVRGDVIQLLHIRIDVFEPLAQA
jgi:hypothetical protein